MKIILNVSRTRSRGPHGNESQATQVATSVRQSNLVFLTKIVDSIARVGTNLFVILLQGGQILTGFGEFSLFHTLSDVPVDEGTLGVHEVELVIDAGEGFGDGSGVSNHANGTLDLSKVSIWDVLGRLVVDTALETGWAPIDELNGALGLDGGNGGVDVLGDNVTTVHQTARHVLSVSRITLSHHVGWLEDGAGDISNRQRFVHGLFGADDRSVRGQHEMDARVRDQVGLKFGDINVQGTIETEGSGQTGDDLGDETVEVGVSWLLNVEVTTANIVESFVVKAKSTIGVLQKGVGGKDRVVRLNDGGRNLRTRGDGKGELGLASVVDGKTFQKKGSKTGSGTSTSSMEDEETLETGTVVSNLTDAVQDNINNLLSDGIMSTGVVVGGVFLSRDDLLRVVELGVLSTADFITDGWFEIDKDSTWDVLAARSLREEGVEGIIGKTKRVVRGHVTIRGDTMLQAVQLPALVSDLDTGLTEVDRDTF